MIAMTLSSTIQTVQGAPVEHGPSRQEQQFHPLRYLYQDDEEWNRILRNRKFLTQKGRDELAALKRQRQTQHGQHHTLGDGRILEVDPGPGTLNVLVCLVQWTNHGKRNTLDPSEVKTLFTGSGRDATKWPGGTINDFFHEMSYGQFKVNVHVTDWYKTSYSEQSFTQDGSQGRTPELEKAFDPALKALDGTGFDFSPYDSDGDKEIDLTIFLHSGYDGLHPGDDCETGAKPLERVASHARTGAPQVSEWESKDGYKLGAYVVAPAYRGWCDAEVNNIGIILHEFCHTFGLPEMYDTDTSGWGSGYLGGIDYYDIMANPRGPGGDHAFPGPLAAWNKYQLGWVEPIEIQYDGIYEIRASAEAPDIYIIRKGYSNAFEYILIENRQPVPGTFDEKFFNPGGITIYHVDEGVFYLFGMGSSIRGNTPKGGPFLDGWPGNGRHYPVALLQADGLYELEQNINGGHSDDLWNSADQKLGPGNGEKIASSAPYPNTDSYNLGNIVVTGITIENFQYKAEGSSTMSFEISGLGGGPAPTSPPVAPTTAPVAPTNAPVAPTKPPVVPTKPPVAPTNAPVAPISAPLAPTNPPVAPPPTEAPVPVPEDDVPDATSSPTTTPDAAPQDPIASTDAPVGTGGETDGSIGGEGCQEALEAALDGSTIQGTTADATQNVSSPVCGASIENPGQWYTFNGTGSSLQITACDPVGSSPFNISISVFSGNCGELTCVSGSTFSDEVCSAADVSVRKRFLQEESSNSILLTAELDETFYLFIQGIFPPAADGSAGTFEVRIIEQTEAPEPVPVSPPSKEDIETPSEVWDTGKGDTENGNDGSSSKNSLYALLVLLILPVLWILRQRLCGCCPCTKEKVLSQPSGKSSSINLGETPFYDEGESEEGASDGEEDDEDSEAEGEEDDDTDDDNDADTDDDSDFTGDNSNDDVADEDGIV